VCVCLKKFSVFNIRKGKNTKRKERKRLQKPKGRKRVKKAEGKGLCNGKGLSQKG